MAAPLWGSFTGCFSFIGEVLRGFSFIGGVLQAAPLQGKSYSGCFLFSEGLHV